MHQNGRFRKMMGTFALVLSLAILTTCLQCGFWMQRASALSFSDVSGSEWFHPHLGVMLEKGIINGFPDGSFRPSSTVNADQFIKMVVVATGTRINPTPYAYWAQGYIDAAENEGYLRGAQLAETDMRKPISRNRMAIILCNVLVELEPASIPSKYLLVTSFIKDFSSAADAYTRYAIPVTFSTGLLSGYPDGTFGGNRSMTRAEAITVIHRLVDNSKRVISSELSRFLAEEEVVVEGISFSYSKDLYNTGLNRDMKYSGITPFFLLSLDRLSFSRAESGKLILTGNLPALPAGYEWIYSISVWHNAPFKASLGGMQAFTTISGTNVAKLPFTGSFRYDLLASDPSQIERIVIDAYVKNVFSGTIADFCTLDTLALPHVCSSDGASLDEIDYDWEGMMGW